MHHSIRRRAALTSPSPLHVPLPRLRPHHVPHALIRRVEDALVEFRGDLDAVERISAGPAAVPARFVLAHVDDVLAAFVAVAAALPAQGSERVGRGDVAVVGGFDVVPGGDGGGDGRGDAGGSGAFGRGDEGGRGAEDGVEVVVDVGFDVDGVRGRG